MPPTEPLDPSASVTETVTTTETTDDERFMDEALAQARRAEEAGEVPVGSVIVFQNQIIARGHNRREAIQDPTAHAELLALRDAAQARGTWRLSGATCYVTLEPCPMCAGALVNARVDRVVYATEDPKAGATSTLYTIGSDLRLNHRFAMSVGVRKEEASLLLKQFFGRIRDAQKIAKLAKRASAGLSPETQGPSEDGSSAEERGDGEEGDHTSSLYTPGTKLPIP